MINFNHFLNFCNKILHISKSVNSLTDPRKKYYIPLSTIFNNLFFTPLFGKHSFLSKDYFNRTNQAISFFETFKEKKDLAVSDTTLIRALTYYFQNDELKSINNKIAYQHDDNFINETLNRRCCIIDGTGLGKYLYEVLIVPGSTDYILNFNKIKKKGKELEAAKNLLIDTTKIFGANYFNLILGDALYYCRNMFKISNEILKSHFLVKTKEDLNVIKDVKFYIENNAEELITYEDYDSTRLCSYKIQLVKNITADTIDYPLQAAIIEEKYTKNGKVEIFYVITDDLNLIPKQLREAAHLRWRIENNGFKELNKLFECKKKKLKNETCCLNYLQILFLLYNIFHLFLNSIDKKENSKNIVVTLKYWMDCIFYSFITECYKISTA